MLSRGAKLRLVEAAALMRGNSAFMPSALRINSQPVLAAGLYVEGRATFVGSARRCSPFCFTRASSGSIHLRAGLMQFSLLRGLLDAPQQPCKPRIGSKVIEHRFHLKLDEVRIAFLPGALQPLKCLVLVTETGTDFADEIGGDVTDNGFLYKLR